MRNVTLICGPPCAGKTTLAHQLAKPGDLILDHDTIARQLGSQRQWRHDTELATAAEHTMQAAIRNLATTNNITAYVIRCLPQPALRARLAGELNAKVLILRPPITITIARAQRDKRPRGTISSIRWWYRNYQPLDIDEQWGYG